MLIIIDTTQQETQEDLMKYLFLCLVTLFALSLSTAHAAVKNVKIDLKYVQCDENGNLTIPNEAISPRLPEKVNFYKNIWSCKGFLEFFHSQGESGKILAKLEMNEVLMNETVNCDGYGCLSLDSVKLRSTKYDLEAPYLGVLTTHGKHKYAYGCHPYSNYKVCE